MKRSRREEQERAAAAAPRSAGQAASPGGILALQRSAGNHAVSQMLAREEQQPEHEPASIKMDDFGPIVLTSWRVRNDRPPTSGTVGRPSGDRDDGSLELELGSMVDKHSPVLAQMAVNGKRFDSSVIEMAGRVMKLTDVFVASYQQTSSGGTAGFESWSIAGRTA